MTWFQITYYSHREGVIGAARCAQPSLEETKQGIVSGHCEILSVKEVAIR